MMNSIRDQMEETSILSGLDTILQDQHIRSILRMHLHCSILKVNYMPEKLLIKTHLPQS